MSPCDLTTGAAVWFWFLRVSVPLSGLVPAGAQAMAEHVRYVPVIGIIVAGIWGLHGMASGGRHRQIGLSAGGGDRAVPGVDAATDWLWEEHSRQRAEVLSWPERSQ